jgi:DNA-binding NarL/FixJ family response regulator
MGIGEHERTAVVADELELVAAGVGTVLASHGVGVVGRARDVRSAVRLTRDHRPGVVVFGAAAEGVVPDRAVAAVKQAVPSCLVVALVNGEHAGDLGLLLAAGTDGLLPRSSDLDTLGDLFGRILGGERVIAPSLVPSLVHRQAPRAERRGSILTARERDVLERIALGRSNRQIAEELFVGEETVKSHCSKIYDKLGARNRHDAVVRGLSLGVLG